MLRKNYITKKKKEKFFVVADTHFGHTNMLTYEPIRVVKMQIEGYNDFDRFLVDWWNITIAPQDEVLHLGDVAFKRGYELAKKLNGRVTLIKGNHDKERHLEFYRELGWDVIEEPRIELECGKRVLQKIRRLYGEHPLFCGLVREVGGKRVLFSHFPVFDENPYDEKYSQVRNMLEFVFIECGCEINIHGHIHSLKAKEPFCVNACLEYNDFEIKRVEELLCIGQ